MKVKNLQLKLRALACALVSTTYSFANLVPSITIVSNDGLYTELVGGLCFSVNISNPAIDTTFVDIVVSGTTTASLGSDFDLNPIQLAFPPNFSGSQSVCVGIFNDTLAEQIEIISLKITNPTNNAVLVDSLINMTIYDDDSTTNTNPCSDLFFSEFVHSFTASDRAIEIFNPTGQVIDLSEYSIKIYFGGSTSPGTVIPLSGFLNYPGTFVACTPSSDSVVKALANSISTQFFFNGGSVIGLYHDTTVIDMFGILGVNPGNFWPVGNGATSSSTIVRKQSIKQGETTWANSNGQWDVYTQGDYTHLGAHTINGCGFVIPPTVTMFTSDASFIEAIGALSISAKIFNPLATATTVDVVIGNNTTANNPVDFTYTPTQLTFPANSTSSQSISISINDDLSIEPDEIVELVLRNVSNGATLLDSVWTLTILNDDFTGIKNKAAASSVLLKPNPVKDILSLTLDKAIEAYEISNLVGQVILKEGNLNSKDLKVNVEDLNSGIYFIRLRNEEGEITKRFSKN